MAGAFLAVGRWLCMALAVAALARAQTEGTQRWRASVSGFVSYSSPAISRDGRILYIGVEIGGGGRLVALTADGEPAWPAPFTRAQGFVSTPALSPDGTVVYAGCLDGRLYALDARTGALRWEKSTGLYISTSPAVAEDGTVYVGAGDGHLYAFTDTGAEKWRFRTGDVIESSPAVGADGTIYVASLDRNLYAVSPQGAERWQFATGGRIFSSPSIGTDGTIYLGSNDQRVYAIAPDGSKRWEYFTNGVVDATPVLGADGTVYVGSGDAFFYALNPEGPDNRREKWRKEIGITNPTTAAVRGDGVIIFGGDDNKLRALNPADGGVRWVFSGVQGDADFIGGAAIVAGDGAIYFGSTDGWLYRLHGNGSPLSTFSSWPSLRHDSAGSGRVERVAAEGRLVNLSTRAQVNGANEPLIIGFAVQTAGQRVHLVRAAGPALAEFGVAGYLPDPKLDLFAHTQTPPLPHGSNDDWGVQTDSIYTPNAIRDTTQAVGAFPLRDGSKDSAVMALLNGGLYSAHARRANGDGGVVLVEVYDAIAPEIASARMINLSARHSVGTGENALFAGFVVGGTERTRLLLRGVGPGLAPFGVSGVLARPRITLYAQATAFAAQQQLRSNQGWTTEGITQDIVAAAEKAGAFPLPAGSADSALIAVVPPGAYTIQISAADGGTGEALVEIYVLP